MLARLLAPVVAGGLAGVSLAAQTRGDPGRVPCPGRLSPALPPPVCAADLGTVLAQPLTWWTLLAAVLVTVAVVAWVRWVRAEVRGHKGSAAFLLVDRKRGRPLAIAGAEPDPPAGASGLPPAASAKALGGGAWRPRLVEGGERMSLESRAMPPTAESPVLPLAGGVHAILVGSAVAGTAPSPAPPLTDATLQLLPGRLLLLDETGKASREFRFVRQAGAVTEVTIGRQDAPPERHVRLLAPTVSRLHARMRWAGGQWTIANLSQTNPLRVNGWSLQAGSAPRMLMDGDRVAVGEVDLLFRER